MVKSNGEEENKKPKPGLWERTKQILKPAALIAAATIGFLLGGPIGVALVLGISAFISHKIDQRDARKNANNQDNKGDKNKSDSHDKENKKEGKGPGLLKRACFVLGAIVLGLLTGGLAGIITAVALVVFDFASGGKITKWSENVVKTPLKLIKEAWSKGKEIQWTSKRGVGEETGQEKGKEQVAERGVAGKGRGENNLPAGFDNLSYSPETAVKAKNPSAGGVEVAKENLQQLPPGGQGVDGKTPISPEVQRQAALAAAPLVGAENSSAGGVEVAKKSLQQPSPNEKGVNGSASNQPVNTKTQGQAAQTANSEDGVKAEGTNPKRPVVGPATGGLAQESPGKGFERGSSN